MREILFRGKANSEARDGEWVYGSLLAESANTFPIIARDYDNDEDWISVIEWDTVAPETVGQFTGLTDTNGNRIFEGDILESRISENPEDWKIWTVGFEDGTFTFESVRKSVKSRRKYRHELNMICVDEVKFYGLVLVGNIHDNPELLEGNEDG